MSSGKTDKPSEQAPTTLTAGSVPSCLRNRNDPPKRHPLDRRVLFPDDDKQMVTGFLEPANPWQYADNVTKDDLVSKYNISCEKHGARPISRVVNQLQTLDYDLDRNESLDLKGEILGPAACETLEEILKRVQFITINLEGTNIDDESSVALFDMMEYYESAVRLNITGNHCIAARGWQACSRMIKRTKCLEELDARNTTLNEQFMPILSRALRLSPQLHVLKLENCNLSGRPLVILSAALKLNTGLKELYLGENYLMQNDATQLSALLKVNTVLQLLDISNNNIQDEGLGHLAEGLVEQSTTTAAGGGSGGGLQVLVLWNNHLSRACGHQLSRVLSHVTSLETLNIGQNVLSNEVLHVNKLALQQNRTLLRLGMQSTHLSCEGAVALAEIVADNPTIQRIDLRDNNLQVAGLMALVLSMKVNKSVTQLDLDDMPRRKHSMGPALEEYMRLVGEIRCYCDRNFKIVQKSEDIIEETTKEESTPPTVERRPRTGSFATRKISLTCETLARSHMTPAEPNPVVALLTEPRRTGGRLRSPAPSPIPSPVASPSPTRSRFQVSRVAESDSPLTPPSNNVFFGSGSRFKVTVVESSSPTTVVTSNNITVGFDTPASLSPCVSISPAPSPTPIPAPLLSSIPSLFPTPMPSPMPSPGVSPNPSPTYISPLSTINVGEAHPLSPLPSGDYKTSVASTESTHTVPVIISDTSLSEKDRDISSTITQLNNLTLETKSSKCETILEESLTTDNNPKYRDLTDYSRSSPRSSVSPPKVSRIRSESEDSDKELYLNRRLPKATDSIDLSAMRVMKQASVSIPDKTITPSQRVRKISSWVQPSVMFSSMTQEDTGKTSSSLEKLLGLFTNPFTRSKVEEEPVQQLERVPEVAETQTSVQKYDPFTRSKVEEEPVQQLERVPEVAETQTSVQKYDTVERTVTNTPKSETQQGESDTTTSISENIMLESSETLTKDTYVFLNDSIKNILPSDKKEICLNSSVRGDNANFTIDSCPKSNGCEPPCDNKAVNSALVFNNNRSACEEFEGGGLKCETWPQGSSVAQLSLLHQAHPAQSHSTPCLTALVFLNSKMSSGLAAEIQKLSPPPNEENVDSTKNISLAL